MTTAEHSRADADRAGLLRRGLRLEYLTIAWNIVESAVGITAAVVAGSVALLGYGIDSGVEIFSGAVIVWLLVSERRGGHEARRLERVAHVLIGFSLFAVAAYIAWDALATLHTHEAPDASPVGMALTAFALTTMWWLARAKRRVATALGSRAMEADAFQATVCWWLSMTVLGGLVLNAALGWWWADPAAAIVVVILVLDEAWETVHTGLQPD